jgi:RNA-directed DNA polymerase
VVRECQAIAQEWLKGMGLELKPSKTRIGHTLQEVDGKVGFNFLGFTVRQFPVGKYHSGKTTRGKRLGFKTIIKPSKEKVKIQQERLADIVGSMRCKAQKDLVKTLNPIISGWSNYYRSACSAKTFQRVDHVLHHLLMRWAKRRHNNKGLQWIVAKYWLMPGWAFGQKDKFTLRKHGRTRIVRHVKVRGEKSPYDGDWTYWASRQAYYPGVSFWMARILKRQGGKCAHCGLLFMPTDLLETHHVKRDGKRTGQIDILHRHCHDAVHGPKAVEPDESVDDND